MSIKNKSRKENIVSKEEEKRKERSSCRGMNKWKKEKKEDGSEKIK